MLAIPVAALPPLSHHSFAKKLLAAKIPFHLHVIVGPTGGPQIQEATDAGPLPPRVAVALPSRAEPARIHNVQTLIQ